MGWPNLHHKHLIFGKATGAATPLAWAHAEYIKLLRSTYDDRVFDLIPAVKNRYIDSPEICQLFEVWRHNWQISKIRPGYKLRLLAHEPFRLTWTKNNWAKQ